MSLERLELQPSNLVCRLTTWTIVQKCKIGAKGPWPRSRDLFVNFFGYCGEGLWLSFCLLAQAAIFEWSEYRHCKETFSVTLSSRYYTLIEQSSQCCNKCMREHKKTDLVNVVNRRSSSISATWSETRTSDLSRFSRQLNRWGSCVSSPLLLQTICTLPWVPWWNFSLNTMIVSCRWSL